MSNVVQLTQNNVALSCIRTLEAADNIMRDLGDSLCIKKIHNDGTVEYLDLKWILTAYKAHLGIVV